MSLSEKQKRFIDFFVETGNATEAARKAGYKAKTESAMRSIGSENLAKLDVYIKERLSELEDARIAKADEVLKTLTRVLRREEKESTVVTCKTKRTYLDDTGRRVTEEKEEPVIVEIPTPIREVNKAAELLGKRYGLYTDKVSVNGAIPVVISGVGNLED